MIEASGATGFRESSNFSGRQKQRKGTYKTLTPCLYGIVVYLVVYFHNTSSPWAVH